MIYNDIHISSDSHTIHLYIMLSGGVSAVACTETGFSISSGSISDVYASESLTGYEAVSSAKAFWIISSVFGSWQKVTFEGPMATNERTTYAHG